MTKKYVFIDIGLDKIKSELTYILNLLSINKKFEFEFIHFRTDDCIYISNKSDADIQVLKDLYTNIQNFNFAASCNEKGFLKLDNGNIDYLTTAFYFVTCAQELDLCKTDKFGRFAYKGSIQQSLSITSSNIVQTCFDLLVSTNPKLKQGAQNKTRSKIFVSHDVDVVNGALFQDGFYALKKIDIIGLVKICYRNILINPQWLNMDKIMKIENEYNFKSTFYWLANKGISENNIKNADYNISESKISNQIKLVEKNGWENGVHKSDSSDSFETEIKKLGFSPKGNRYHFLKFHPHIDFEKIENTGLLFDSSLGFAEEIGFRNGYGLPYKPYNFEKKVAYNFIECPLTIMDTTMHGYQKINSAEAYSKIVSFVSLNQEDCVLSLLWHNNYFTEYKYSEYFKLFKKLLSYFYENKFECITQSEIIKSYI